MMACPDGLIGNCSRSLRSGIDTGLDASLGCTGNQQLVSIKQWGIVEHNGAHNGNGARVRWTTIGEFNTSGRREGIDCEECMEHTVSSKGLRCMSCN